MFMINTSMKISEILNERAKHLREDDNVNNLPEFVYHVTPARNLRSIVSKGLRPSVGDRSSKIAGEQSAVYCFPDKASLEDALMNWLGDEFDEDEQLALLKIDTTGLSGTFTPNAEYEVTLTEVPPKNITIVTKDIDSHLFEASGYIPSEAERDDPRFERALSVDVHPDTMKKSAAKFGWKIARDGRPPILSPSGK